MLYFFWEKLKEAPGQERVWPCFPVILFAKLADCSFRVESISARLPGCNIQQAVYYTDDLKKPSYEGSSLPNILSTFHLYFLLNIENLCLQEDSSQLQQNITSFNLLSHFFLLHFMFLLFPFPRPAIHL